MRNIKRTLPCFAIRTATIGMFLFFVTVGQSTVSDSQQGAAMVSGQELMAKKIAAGQILGNFKPSLAIEENVTFMLTPAFLMQQAISDDHLTTFPAK